MTRSILLLAIAAVLPSCALTTKSGTATFNPDAETVRAVSDLVRIVRSGK